MATVFRPLRNKKGEVVGVTKFDAHLVGILPFNFHMRHQLNKPKYAVHCKTFLHRYLVSPLNGYFVDHINGDSLDNRLHNIRIVTYSENNRNTKSNKNTSSKYKGVSWLKESKKWRAAINIDGKKISLGCFVSESDAAIAYNEAAKKYHGEFARLNNLTGGGLSV